MGAPTPQFRRGTVGQQAVQAEQTSPASTGTTGTTKTAVKPNKYAAPCVNCGVRVPEGEGRLEKNNGKWEVSHIPPCPEPGPQAEQEPAKVEHKQTVVTAPSGCAPRPSTTRSCPACRSSGCSPAPTTTRTT
jgi:hypothetical protein